MPCSAKPSKPETYAKAEMVSDPINMFDMAPNADGAAALVLNSPRAASVRFAESTREDRWLRGIV